MMVVPGPEALLQATDDGEGRHVHGEPAGVVDLGIQLQNCCTTVHTAIELLYSCKYSYRCINRSVKELLLALECRYRTNLHHHIQVQNFRITSQYRYRTIVHEIILVLNYLTPAHIATVLAVAQTG